MRADLGLAPPDDRDGCLQDVHWYCGSIGGGFQSYTIGNILSAQLFAAAIKAQPDISSEIASGQFGKLRGWLTDNIYRHGRTLSDGKSDDDGALSGLSAHEIWRALSAAAVLVQGVRLKWFLDTLWESNSTILAFLLNCRFILVTRVLGFDSGRTEGHSGGTPRYCCGG
jgi:Carboxypeptidase Taq (M32) metallopeptidase